MKILLTGATSGLGRNAVDFLQNRNIPFIATGRNRTVGQQLMQQGVDFRACDLAQADESVLTALFDGVTAVWHCAALSSPWGNYADFYQANVVATEQLARVAAKHGVSRFIHISTPSIYFDFQHHHHLCETDCAAKRANHYAETKWIAEQKIQQLAKKYPQTQFVILRPRAIFGAYDKVLLPRLLDLLTERHGVLPLPNDGKVKMDVTYALNVVHAMFLATEQTFSSQDGVPTFNITNQEPIELRTLLDKLFRQQLGRSFRIKSVPYPLIATLARTLECIAKFTKKEPKLTAYSAGTLYFDMILNNDKAIRELGYRPLYPLEDAIAQTAQWLKNEGIA